jgi:hypothetical protein
MIYEYKCPVCSNAIVTGHRDDRFYATCDACGFEGDFKRVFAVNIKPPMHEHFNHAVGKPISDMKQFRDELRRKSDLASEQTGIEHRYAPIDMNDRETLGVTGDGIDESNRLRERRGEPLLPAID